MRGSLCSLSDSLLEKSWNFRWASLLGEIAYQGEECGGSDESVGKWRWCAERLRDDGGW